MSNPEAKVKRYVVGCCDCLGTDEHELDPNGQWEKHFEAESYRAELLAEIERLKAEIKVIKDKNKELTETFTALGLAWLLS